MRSVALWVVVAVAVLGGWHVWARQQGDQRERVTDWICGYATALGDITLDAELGPGCQEILWLATRHGVPRVRGAR